MSVSLTISNLDDETFRRLQAEAKRTGSDPATVAKSVLEKNLPKEPAASGGTLRRLPHHDLDHLAGTWTEEEYQEFMAAIADFGKIEPEEWR